MKQRYVLSTSLGVAVGNVIQKKWCVTDHVLRKVENVSNTIWYVLLPFPE